LTFSVLFSDTSHISELCRLASYELETISSVLPLISSAFVAEIDSISAVSEIGRSKVHHERCRPRSYCVSTTRPIRSEYIPHSIHSYATSGIDISTISAIHRECYETRGRHTVESSVVYESLPVTSIREAISLSTWTSCSPSARIHIVLVVEDIGPIS
jgi:hypothetical protein